MLNYSFFYIPWKCPSTTHTLYPLLCVIPLFLDNGQLHLHGMHGNFRVPSLFFIIVVYVCCTMVCSNYHYVVSIAHWLWGISGYISYYPRLFWSALPLFQCLDCDRSDSQCQSGYPEVHMYPGVIWVSYPSGLIPLMALLCTPTCTKTSWNT